MLITGSITHVQYIPKYQKQQSRNALHVQIVIISQRTDHGSYPAHQHILTSQQQLHEIVQKIFKFDIT